MPIEVEQDGKKITAYTQEELDNAVAGAKTGLLSEEEAKKLADSVAAKARREAEGKLADLQKQLAEAGQSGEKVAQLEKQIAEQAGKLTGAERALKGLKVLAGAGLAPAAAEQLLALPLLAQADFDSEDGQKKAVEGLKGAFPMLFQAPEQQQRTSFAPIGGVGGSPQPGGGAMDNDALAKMPMSEYVKWRQGQGK